ncbi:MAG: HigA family addiction module antitoxin [Pseudomonadota bacterium]
MRQKLAPVHPGRILLLDFLEPMGISQYRLAKSIRVPQPRIGEIVHGKRAVTADTALRLGRFFGMEPQFWMSLQAHYEREVATDALGSRLDTEVVPYAA